MGDGGVDVVAIKRRHGILIQCKTSSISGQYLGWGAVKEVVAGAAAYQVKHAVTAGERARQTTSDG